MYRDAPRGASSAASSGSSSSSRGVMSAGAWAEGSVVRPHVAFVVLLLVADKHCGF